MDPLSALSLASTIVQFIHFGIKLLSSSVELHKFSRGVLKVHEELELVTRDLQSVIVKLRGTSSIVPEAATQPLTEDDQRQQDSFQKMCDEAAHIAE